MTDLECAARLGRAEALLEALVIATEQPRSDDLLAVRDLARSYLDVWEAERRREAEARRKKVT